MFRIPVFTETVSKQAVRACGDLLLDPRSKKQGATHGTAPTQGMLCEEAVSAGQPAAFEGSGVLAAPG